MAEFLSDAWLDQLAKAAAAAEVPAGVRAVVQQVVLVDRGREVAFAVRFEDGRAMVEQGRVADADISFTQDRATAVAIARGDLGAQAAFLAGRLRVGGAPHRLMDAGRDLAALADIFHAVRSTTTWGPEADGV